MNTNLSFQIPNSKLPRGWRWVKLGEVCASAQNRDPKTTPDLPFRYVDISSIDNNSKKIIDARTILGRDAPSRAKQIIRINDVLVATTRPNLNAVALVPEELNDEICSTGFSVFRAKELIDPSFLFAFVQTQYVIDTISGQVRGMLYPAVTDRQVRDVYLPLPPLPEQKRIAVKVQELMQEMERARTACEKQLEAVRALHAAYLREVFESEEAKKWERKKVGEILKEPLKNGLNYRKEDFGTGIKFVNVSDVFCTESTDNEKLGRINVSLKDVKKYQLQTGDILIVRSSLKREGVAYPALFIEDEEPVVFCGFLIRIRPDKGKVAPFYLLNYLRSSIAREKLVGDSDTVTITNVDQGTLLSLDIPIPSLDEQQRITFELKEKMAQVENLQSAIQNQHSALSVLPQSILRKAFSGEL